MKSISLDHHREDADRPDLLQLVLCPDFDGIKKLITDPRGWVGDTFLKGKRPTNKYLKQLLGTGYRQPTIEFVYPVETIDKKDIIVQFLVGTNAITVRNAPTGGGGADFLEDGPLTVTLFSADENSTSGLAYTHQHFDSKTTIDDVLNAVAWIVRNPLDRLSQMNDLNVKTIQKVHKNSDVGSVICGDKDSVTFKIKPRRQDCPDDDNQDGELRFIFLCHLPSKAGKPFADNPLPCIKASGPYVQPDPDGPIQVAVDTIIFVDYGETA